MATAGQQLSIAVHSFTYTDGAVLSSTGDGAVPSHKPFLPFLTAIAMLNRGVLLHVQRRRSALLDGHGAQSRETPLPSLHLLVLPLFLRF
ncbi:uncharacterized protein DS421_20g694440 [Arachis hypogaea]|nr:uncharacterized protein DS421_20g694440 [Arachis hypogaea]